MWSDSKRRLGNCGGVARAKPVINCVTPGGSMCAAGGGTTGASYAGLVWAHAPGGSKQSQGLASGRDRQPADGAFERHSSSLWIPLNLTQFHQNLKFKKPTIEQCRALLAASTLSSIIDSDGSPHARSKTRLVALFVSSEPGFLSSRDAGSAVRRKCAPRRPRR